MGKAFRDVAFEAAGTLDAHAPTGAVRLTGSLDQRPVDISATLDRKVAAACCHRTMMRNFFNQLRLQADTGGWRIPAVDDALAAGDVSPVLTSMLRAGSEGLGAKYGVGAAEEFRVVTFGGMQRLLDSLGERV